MLAPAIAVMPSLTECKLRGNTLGIKGWTEILNALRNSPTSKITTWDLSYEGLGPDIAKPLAEYLSVTASLTSVSLLANQFDDETVAMLLKLKEEKPTLTTLCGLKPDQTEVELSLKKLGPQDAKLLAPEISVMPSLTKLDIQYIELGEEGEAVLRKAVEGRSGFELVL